MYSPLPDPSCFEPLPLRGPRKPDRVQWGAHGGVGEGLGRSRVFPESSSGYYRVIIGLLTGCSARDKQGISKG